MAEPAHNIWIPSPGEPCYITGLTDCPELALASGDFPPFERLLVLLNNERAIIARSPSPTRSSSAGRVMPGDAP